MTDVEQQSRIPEFQSRDEAAAWFDTHDLADYQDEFATVEVRFRRDLSEGLHIRLDPDSLTKLRETANRRGVGPTTRPGCGSWSTSTPSPGIADPIRPQITKFYT